MEIQKIEMIKNRKKPRISQAVHLCVESCVFCLEFEEGDRGRG